MLRIHCISNYIYLPLEILNANNITVQIYCPYKSIKDEGCQQQHQYFFYFIMGTRLYLPMVEKEKKRVYLALLVIHSTICMNRYFLKYVIPYPSKQLCKSCYSTPAISLTYFITNFCCFTYYMYIILMAIDVIIACHKCC